MRAFISAVLFVIVALYVDVATAQEFDGKFVGNVVALSEYSPRGFSLSNRDPAFHTEGTFYFKEGPYVGVGFTTIDAGDGGEAKAEVISQAGVMKNWAGLTWDAGALVYNYPGGKPSRHYDFQEVKLAVTKESAFGSITGTIYYAPNFYAGTDKAVYKKINVKKPLGGNWGLVGSIARYNFTNNTKLMLPDYWHWSGGVSYTYQSYYATAVFHDSNMSYGESFGRGGPRVILMLAKFF